MLDKTLLTGAQIRLSQSCFENKTVPDDFRIPEGTREIDMYTFRNAVLPEGFTLPDSVTEIADCAFENTVLPESFQLPPLLTTIGRDAFRNARFKKLIIPRYFGCYIDGNDSEHRYKIAEFTSAQSEQISVDPGNFYYDSRNNCNAVIETKSNTLLVGSSSTVIPDTVTSVWLSAFCYVWPSNLNLPASITNIDFFTTAAYVAEGNFSKINIDLTVFKRNTVSVDPKNPVYDSRNNCNAVIETKTNKLLIGCPGTIIPSDITEICELSFSYLTMPDDFIIPEGVKVISKNAFKGAKIKKLFIPKSVTHIDDLAFIDAEIGEISVDSENPKYDSRDNCNAIIDKKRKTVIAVSFHAVIPEGITNNILPYEIPKDYYLTHVDDDVLGDPLSCHAYMDGFVIPKAYTYNKDWRNCVFKGPFTLEDKGQYLTFKNCIFEVDFNYPKELKLSLFWNSIFKGNVTIPSGIKTIPECLFENAQFQAGLKLPKGLNVIQDGAFQHAKLPEDFTIPEGIKKIGASAFYDTNITQIFIPAKVEMIDVFAFTDTDCRNISVSPANPVYDSRNNCNAIIETKTNKLIAGWHHTVIPDTVTTIARGAFQDVVFDDDFTIPEGVTTIEREAFRNAILPENFIIPASVEEIEEGAFKNAIFKNGLRVKAGVKEIQCLALTHSVIYGNLTLAGNVSSYNFNGTLLPDGDIILPEGVKSIEVEYLSDVTAKRLFIPKSVENISVAPSLGAHIETIVIDPGNPKYDSRNNCNAIMETATNTLIAGCMNTIIPDNCEKITQDAFNGVTLPKNFRIPESVKEIEGNAFQNAVLCENFVFPGIETMHEWMFMDAIIPKGFRISEGVETIEMEAFKNVIFPEGFQLPVSCKNYEEEVFYNAAFQKDWIRPEVVKGVFAGSRKFN